MYDGCKQRVRIVPNIVLGKINPIRPFAIEVGILLVEGVPLDGERFTLNDTVLGRGKVHDVQVDAGHLNDALKRFQQMITGLVSCLGSINGNRIFTRHIDCVLRGDQSHTVGEHRNLHINVLPIRRCHFQSFAQR